MEFGAGCQDREVVQSIECQRAREATGNHGAQKRSRRLMPMITRRSDDPRTHLWRPDFPDAREPGGPVDTVWAEIDDKKLIMIAMQDFLGGGVVG